MALLNVKKKLIFNTYLLLVCQLLVILTAHPWNSAPHRKSNQLTSPALSETSQSFLHLSEAWVKILTSVALTSDIRQASDRCSKCCTSKQELRIRDEYWGSLFSVASWDPEICQTTLHFDKTRTACYQQKCPVVTASPEKPNNTLAGAISAVKDISQKY